MAPPTGKADHDGLRDASWPKGLTRRAGYYRFRRMIKGHRISISFGEMSERQAIERSEQLNLQNAAGIDIAQQTRKATASRSRHTCTHQDLQQRSVSTDTSDSLANFSTVDDP